MAKSIKGLFLEQNRSDYDLQMHNLQAENLRLSTKQLKRYYTYSIISFISGIISAAFILWITTLMPEKVEKSDTLKLEQRITTLEQTVDRLVDSIQTLKVLNTIELDSLKKP